MNRHTRSHPIMERMQRAGCWALGVYAFALFFALGAVVSLLNGDMGRFLQALIVMVLLTCGGIWLVRRRA